MTAPSVPGRINRFSPSVSCPVPEGVRRCSRSSIRASRTSCWALRSASRCRWPGTGWRGPSASRRSAAVQLVPPRHERVPKRLGRRVAPRPFQPFAGVPVPIGRPRGARPLAPEDVRMAPDHLLPRRRQQGVEGGPALALEDEREEQRRVEHVSQLLRQLLAAPAARGLEHLPGLFDEAGQQGGHGLHPVPRAAAGTLQPPRRGDQLPERIRDSH